MKHSFVLFWNVDTQNDFVEPWGKLYVPGAELLKPVWAQITGLAQRQEIRVINTADHHYIYSAEIDEHPDMESTFPPHCMAGTLGAEYIAETAPDAPAVFNWDKEYLIPFNMPVLQNIRNIVIRKDAFDVFAGNRVTEKIVEALSPEVVVVYGVTTNICVNYAVIGLHRLVEKVYVVEDAIRELPNLPLPFEKWQKLGVKMISSQELLDAFP